MSTRRTLLILLAVLAATVAPPRAATVLDEVLDAVDAARGERDAGALERRDALDRVAAQHAARVAALPPDRRLEADVDMGPLLEAAAIGYRDAWIHMQLHYGAPDLARAVVGAWSGKRDAWAEATDPKFDAIGEAAVTAPDGWTIVVAILVDDPPVHPDLATMEQAVREAINRERVARGFVALGHDDALAAIARRHSQDMARRDYFSHTNPEGLSSADRVLAAGVTYRRVAENIHSNHGVDDPVDRAVGSWIASPQHRQALLTPGFRLTGVGAARAENGALYFTQLFLTP